MTHWFSRHLFNVRTLIAAFVMVPGLLTSPAAAQADCSAYGDWSALQAGGKAALFIGNQNYDDADLALRRPALDAALLAEAFDEIGFATRTATDLDYENLLNEVECFGAALAASDAALGVIYLAGHGGAPSETSRFNFFLPTDYDAAASTTRNLERYAVELDRLIDLADVGETPLVTVFDACRNQLFRSTGDDADLPAGSGLAGAVKPRETPGRLIAFSQSESKMAADDGAYAKALAETATKSGLTVEEAFNLVQTELADHSGGAQIPWIWDGVADQICFSSCAAANDDTDALEAFLRALETGSDGDLGQVEAFAALLEAGRTFEAFLFYGANLSGVEAKGLAADRADFSLSTLDDGDFEGASMKAARFAAADMRKASFKDADLTGGDFHLARALDTNFSAAVLSRANFEAADLRGADFSNTDLTAANFNFADLRGARFDGAVLTNTFFGGADLGGASFEGAELNSVDVTAAVLEPSQLDASDRSALCASVQNRNSRYYVDLENVEGGGYVEIEDTRLPYVQNSEADYPKCEVIAKEKMSLWGYPTALGFHGGTAWRESFGVRIDSRLVRSTADRAHLSGRVDAFTASVPERLARLYETTYHAGLRDEAITAFKKNARDAAPGEGAYLGFFPADLTILAIKRLRSVDDLPEKWGDWRAITAGWRARGYTRPRQSQDMGFIDWPRIFPDGFLPAYLNDEADAAMISALKRLASKSPASLLATLSYRHSGFGDDNTWQKVMAQNRGRFEDAAELAPDIAARSFDMSNFTQGNYGRFPTGRVRFLVDQSLYEARRATRLPPEVRNFMVQFNVPRVTTDTLPNGEEILVIHLEVEGMVAAPATSRRR